MAAHTVDGVDRRHIAASIAPFIIVALAGLAIRTPLAIAHPFAALLLFLWVTADTLMLSLFVRSAGKPAWGAVLGVPARAALTVWLGSPSAMRNALFETSMFALTMAGVVLAHVAWATARACKALDRKGIDQKERWVSAASEIFRQRWSFRPWPR